MLLVGSFGWGLVAGEAHLVQEVLCSLSLAVIYWARVFCFAYPGSVEVVVVVGHGLER